MEYQHDSVLSLSKIRTGGRAAIAQAFTPLGKVNKTEPDRFFGQQKSLERNDYIENQ